jgi:hypothetical protein
MQNDSGVLDTLRVMALFTNYDSSEAKQYRKYNIYTRPAIPYELGCAVDPESVYDGLNAATYLKFDLVWGVIIATEVLSIILFIASFINFFNLEVKNLEDAIVSTSIVLVIWLGTFICVAINTMRLGDKWAFVEAIEGVLDNSCLDPQTRFNLDDYLESSGVGTDLNQEFALFITSLLILLVAIIIIVVDCKVGEVF